MTAVVAAILASYHTAYPDSALGGGTPADRLSGFLLAAENPLQLHPLTGITLPSRRFAERIERYTNL